LFQRHQALIHFEEPLVDGGEAGPHLGAQLRSGGCKLGADSRFELVDP
jgi:hypothetical protein